MTLMMKMKFQSYLLRCILLKYILYYNLFLYDKNLNTDKKSIKFNQSPSNN